ncbi:MAG: cytochrome c family protein [Proteobacteria bacterium]|nr:cytochrome c family protein [Pseudomonadota bacterium]
MKTGSLFSAMIIGGILLSGSNSQAVDNKGAESIVLKGGSLGSITLSHRLHQGVLADCKPCHELFPKESQVVDKMKAEGKLQRKNVMDMCKKCHKDMADKGQKTGPTNCTDCHKR